MKRRLPPEAGDGRADDPGQVCLGAIAGAHGVAGLVRVKSFTERPEDIAAYGPVRGDDGACHRLEVVGQTRGLLIARIAGIRDRDAARKLAGTRLSVARGKLPAPEQGAYYHADLIGLRVERPDGTPVGAVAGVCNFGAGDLIGRYVMRLDLPVSTDSP